jgi:hypothetical protein
MLRASIGEAAARSGLASARKVQEAVEPAGAVDGGVNPRKSGAGQKVGTKIAVELFKANGLSG